MYLRFFDSYGRALRRKKNRQRCLSLERRRRGCVLVRWETPGVTVVFELLRVAGRGERTCACANNEPRV